MSEVKRYHVQLFKLGADQQKYAHGALGAVELVRASDFDRVTAERNALQLSLTAADERVDRLETEIEKLKAGLKWEYERNALLLTELQDLERETGSKQPALSDDDIPDFTPGNGNRARRRAAAIDALKPENQRIVPCNTEQRPDYFKCLKVD